MTMRTMMTTMTELLTILMMTMTVKMMMVNLKKMMMMPQPVLSPLASAMELLGDPSCSSVTENQRRFSTRKDKLKKKKKKRMARPKSNIFLWYQSPCRHSIMNQTNSLDSHGLTPMYLMTHHAQ